MRLTAGTRVGNYTLDERIGHGASGEVWKANDGSKTVAMKFMNENLMRSASAEKHRMRLEREVEALRRLQHPNVPTLYDYDLDSDRPWIAMRYIGGQTYDRLISSGEMLRIPLDTRLNAIRELAMALKAAHSLGIVHRDIKPSNMSGVETPYLLDFSISLPASEVMHTVFNVGTAFYMDPEDPPNEAADIYAFALVAYEMLFGKHAIFTQDDLFPQMPEHTRFTAGERILNREWRFPSTIPANEVPFDLRNSELLMMDDAFEKALGPRNQRYTDLSDFVNDLTRGVKTLRSNVDRNAATMLEAMPSYQPPPPQARPASIESPLPRQAPPPRPTPAGPPPAAAGAENFTMLEVEGDKTPTDVEPKKPSADDGEKGGLLGKLFGRRKDAK